VYLDDLIESEYVDPIKDPNDSSQYCDLEKSYVYITNRADMSTSKNYDLQYKVCLICGDTESEYCRENIDIEGDFASVCHIYYDEAATIPYDNKWTDKDLYLKFTSEGNYKLGISHYEYQPKGESRWTSVDTPQNIDTITVQLKNTVANKTYQVRGYDDFKRVGTIGECLSYDSSTGLGSPATIKIDKEKVISASISAKKATSGTTVSSGTWSNENLTLTATGNPTSVVSGYQYQWYKDGLAISGATNKTYTATETGVYKVKITNGVGSQSVTSPEYNARVDKVKPVISKIDNPTNENWTDKNFAVTLTVTETQSMIDYYQYKYEDTDWKKYENSNTSPFTTTDFSKERDEYVYFQVVDIAGNKSEIVKTMIRIDKTDISTVTLAGKTANGTAVTSGTWKAENIILTGTVNPTSVISGYKYQWYKDGVAISGATSLTYNATETGNYTLKVTSGVGKTKTSSAFDVKIDKTILNTTKPTITASDSKASGSWHTANFTLTPSGVTSPSGITYYYGTASNNITTEYTSPIPINENTTGITYYFKACNKAGTCTNVSSYTAKLDKSTMSTKPTITASDSIKSDKWHTANFTLTPSGVTSTSGVTYYYGKTSGNLTTKYTTPVSITENTAGVTYYFKACNGAGTCSDESNYIVKLDKSTPAAPTVTASDSISSGSWHTANFTLTPSGSSSTSGITYHYGTSAKPETTYTSVSVSTNTTGANHYFRACNGAGTCSSDTLYVAKLDKGTPTCTISASDGIGSGSWHTENFTLSLNGSSTTSGTTCYYGTSSSNITSAGSSISVTTNTASTTYYVRGCNGAGTCSSVSSYTAKLDKATPSCTISASDGIGSGSWHTANFTLSLSGSSTTSGTTCYYGTTSNPTTKYSSAISVSNETSSTPYYYKACNGAGKCSSVSSYTAKLDKATPSCTISASDGIGSGSWHTANFTLSLSGSSTTSGTTCYYGTTSNPTTKYSSSISVSNETSSTSYYYKACNGAGTCSGNSSYSVKLDKTKPTVSYNVAGGTYTTTKTVTITASDTNFSSMSVETYKNGAYQSGKSVSGRTSNTYSVALDSSGSWVIYTKVYDAAGQVQMPPIRPNRTHMRLTTVTC